MSRKYKFSDYTAAINGSRSLDEAISELVRESDVRRRLYDRWVAEGRMSWVDANDRLARHLTAISILVNHASTLQSAAEQEEIDAERNDTALPDESSGEHTKKVLDNSLAES